MGFEGESVGAQVAPPKNIVRKAKDKSQKFYKSFRSDGRLALSVCDEEGIRSLSFPDDKNFLDALKAKEEASDLPPGS